MREKNRKPIGRIKKLPQFTTMNVIDGQAGLVNYSSLILYSLTIDNILNIIILIILATVAIAINFAFGNNGLIMQAQKAKDMTANSIVAEQEGMNSVLSEYLNVMGDESEITPPEPPDEPVTPPVETPPTDGTFSAEEGVNTPNIGPNMELVIFNDAENTWEEDPTKEAYSYNDTETEGANSSEWANAKVTIDGIDSYFVWIPRYAYKINGTNDIDIKFLQGTGNLATDGTVCKYADDPTLDTTTDYIIHPAFTANADLGGGFGNNNGTNDNGISGIWIGKYETARSDSEGETLKVQPNVTSFRSVSIANMYTYSLAYAPSLESHMLKNSEWGAVAYLTESKYGRNGTEVTINNNGTTYYTGGGADNAYITNTTQSSTGNVYGIYDLSGNACEYVAAAYSNRSEIGTTNGSTKYATVYDGTDVNTNYKYGDATYETSGWHSDNAYFVNSSSPFFARGGVSFNGSDAGVFSFNRGNGHINSDSNLYSFRLSLVV